MRGQPATCRGVLRCHRQHPHRQALQGQQPGQRPLQVPCSRSSAACTAWLGPARHPLEAVHAAPPAARPWGQGISVRRASSSRMAQCQSSMRGDHDLMLLPCTPPGSPRRHRKGHRRRRRQGGQDCALRPCSDGPEEGRGLPLPVRGSQREADLQARQPRGLLLPAHGTNQQGQGGPTTATERLPGALSTAVHGPACNASWKACGAVRSGTGCVSSCPACPGPAP